MNLSLVFLATSLFLPAPQSDALPRRGSLGLAFSPVPDEVRSKLDLKPGEGLLAAAPVAGLTAQKAGIKAGDVLLMLNDKPVSAGTLGAQVRGIPAGQPIRFSALRDGKKIELTANLVERPRDPGGANFTVEYSHIVSNGLKMRTIITTPKKPGKHPGFMFIQGFSPVSYDFTLETSTGDVTTIDGPLLFDFANSNFVTIRVEKPGVGDSEGGPFAELDYTTELDIYRQTLKQLKSLPGVDTENVFIFGHSMGGSFGPMIASENPVKGIAVYGTAARTWHEYILDTLRYQGIVGGGTYEAADEEVRTGSRLLALLFHENMTVEQVKKSHPELATFADQLMPGGMFNGKTLEFWRQLGKTNFASYWSKLDAYVLSVRGQSDFVTYDADHKLIADIVNRRNPGRAKFVIAPESDHLFHTWPTEQASMAGWTKGKFNLAFSKMMKDWIAEVMAKRE